MKKQFLLLLVLSLSFSSFSLSRQVIQLSKKWQFTPGYEVNKNVFTEVALPHTWNLDAISGKVDYYRGFGNYQKKIAVPESWRGQRVYLRFGAVNHTATVLINGKTVGEHQGGYTAFGFDISDKLTYGAVNTIDVRVSNALDLGVMPLVGDFNFYGGIYRDVELIVLPENHISLSNYASSGVRIIQDKLTKQQADVRVRVRVEGGGLLRVSIKDAKGNLIAQNKNR